MEVSGRGTSAEERRLILPRSHGLERVVRKGSEKVIGRPPFQAEQEARRGRVSAEDGEQWTGEVRANVGGDEEEMPEMKDPFVNDDWEGTQDFSAIYPDHSPKFGGMMKAMKKYQIPIGKKRR